MKVYIFVRQSVYKHYDSCIETSAFTTKEDAREALVNWRNDEMESLTEQGWTVENDSPDCFEIFREGDWCCNHSCAYVKEFDL